ncbi:helix-turn-helix domain-containing protein [Tenggerimyces flavus]|uniref:Helix-turn-helix domain-containing protein n=1 Tax=Tenggerimyces flavus TaxID=1708749 RepID=A0ABV7Y2H8_9ACTN|nr:helix-turn-helix domain-containing protein [Tenggerimyces flavus]MBM7790695.1 DNA-binding transcriptional ArsR family regulator [Tenggerimyces flavus]
MSLEVSSLRALAHPIRLRILSLLTGAVMSASEVARELGITQANASYHIRTLAAAGYLDEMGEESIRGGIAKRYAYAHRDDRDRVDNPPDPEANLLFARAVADELVRRVQFLAKGPSSYTDAELWIDEDDWAQAIRLSEEASTLLHKRAHPPRTEGTIHVNATVAMFRMES